MEPTNQGEAAKLSQVIQIDEGKIQEHLGEVVRSTVEETLNAMLDAEADRLCRAERYERTEARKDTRAGLAIVDAGSFRVRKDAQRAG
jgi:putative transposase